MDWKEKIKQQLTEASKQNAIGSNLKQLVKDLLKGDTEFIMVYHSARGQYGLVRFMTSEIGLETRKIILTEYGAHVWKLLKQQIR